MSAALRQPDLARDVADFRFAALSLAFPIVSGAISYSAAVGGLAQACIREGVMGEDPSGVEHLDDVLAELERLLHLSIIDITSEATAAIRNWLRLCLSRGMLNPAVLLEGALSFNRQHGEPLPTQCIDRMIRHEVRHARS